MRSRRRRRLRSFMRWMESWEIELSDGVQIVEGEDEGIACGEVGVRAAYDLKEGDAIAFIPKEACLTLRTTGAAQVLDDAHLSGGLGLVVALMYERSRGEASPWFPYLNLLPLRHDALPIVWESEEIHTLLLGTELHTVVMEDRRLIEEDWRECIWPLTQLYPNQFPEEHFTLELYFSAKTIVASRSFEVDSFHGYGMVPFADLFNHKTNGEDVHIMGNARMVIAGGAFAEEENGCSVFNVLEEPVPLDRDSNCSSRSAKGQSSSDVLEMVLVRDVSEGSEIFNTYGELSNASLLHRHGFTEHDNPFDIVNIDFTLVMQYCTSFFSKRHVRNRVRLWRKYGCNALRSQTTDYFEVEACCRPQTELLCLLYILHLSEEAIHAADIALHELEAAGEDRSNLDWEVKVKETMINLSNQALGRGDRNLYSLSEFKQGVKDLDRMFLTAEVCEGLIWLSEKRDKAYGQTSLEDDLKFLKTVSLREEPKLYNSLSLRISERSILKRLVCFSFEELRKLR